MTKPPIPRPALAAATSAAQRRRGVKIEHGLIACGLVCALASSSFAAFMISHNTGRPDVHAGEYFTVFAQIDRQQRARAAVRAAEREAQQTRGTDADIDPIVTGSIRPAAKADRRAAPLVGFALREVFDGTALVDTPSGVQVVRPGATLAGAGRVIAIERRGDRMVVVTEGGIVQGEVE